MKETQFVAEREHEWLAWDFWLGDARPESSLTTGIERVTTISSDRIPHAFRRLCQDLSLARDRGYSAPVQLALQRRVFAVHQRIYGARRADRHAWWRFLASGLPALVRAELPLVALAAALLLVPLVLMIAAIQMSPEATFLVIAPESVSEIESMYSPAAEHLGRPARASTAWTMWGLYVANNVRIDFQCFAAGIAFGLGSIFFLIYNGLYIGAVAGHLTRIGYIPTFWGFVAGHSAFELTGAILSGAAGLRLGLALIAPGPRRRGAALTDAGRIAVRLLAGAAFLTFLAAFIEAFWSPLREVSVPVKYGVGIALWMLVFAYFAFAPSSSSVSSAASVSSGASAASAASAASESSAPSVSSAASPSSAADAA